MKVKELKKILRTVDPEDEVVIAIQVPGCIGCEPFVKAISTMDGFDWESGLFYLHPERPLKIANPDPPRAKKNKKKKK